MTTKISLEYAGKAPTQGLSGVSVYEVVGGTQEQQITYAEKLVKKNGYARKGREWHEGYCDKLGNVNGKIVLYFVTPSTD